MGQCEMDGCPSQAELNRAGRRVCRPHYGRHYRTGKFGDATVKAQRKAHEECIVEGCSDLDRGAHGYCPKHFTRILRHGDPHTVIPVGERNIATRTRNSNWTGDEATYVAVHIRLGEQRGKASSHSCVDCGRQARQWSYNNAGGERERHSRSGVYSISVGDYEPRCVSCHRKFDYQFRPPKRNPVDVEYVIEQYKSGRGYASIGNSIHVSAARIRDVLIDNGLKIRGPGGDQRRVIKSK